MSKGSGEPALLKAAGKGDAERCTLLIELGIDVDCTTKFKRTPLAVACWHGNVAAVKALIEGRASVNARDSPGLTPLHLSFSSRSEHCEEIVDILIKSGAAVDLVTNKGETAAHFAARQGELKALKTLVDCGADLSISTDGGQTVLDWAKIHRQPEVVKFLMSDDLTHKRRTPSNQIKADTFNSLGKIPTKMPKKINVGRDSGVGHVDCLSPDLQSEMLHVKTKTAQNRLVTGPQSPGSPELWSEVQATKATFNALDSYALFKEIVEEQFDGSMTQEDELLLTELMEMGFDDAENKEEEEEVSGVQQSSESTDDDSQSSISGNETVITSSDGSNVTNLGQFENQLLKQENANLRETLAQYQDLIEQLSTHVDQ